MSNLMFRILTTAVCGLSLSAHADTSVSDDVIVPEGSQYSSEDEQVVLVKKPPAKRKVVVVEEESEEYGESVGKSIDKSINKKLNDARNKMVEKLADAIDKIEISVGDDSASPQSQPVEDQIVQRASATESETLPLEGESVTQEESQELKGSLGIFPIFGLTSLSSDDAKFDSRYTAGLGFEVDVSPSVSLTASYRYSEYDASIKNTSNPYFGTIYNPYLTNFNSGRTFEYSQNVVDLTGRYYVLPKNYRYRFYLGAGLGYNLGYLNYDQKTLDELGRNAFYRSSGALDDYEVKSFLGIVELGGEIQLSKAFSIGLGAKYQRVLNSSDSTDGQTSLGVFDPSNLYNPYGTNDKNTIGQSLSESDFYSLLASVKVTF